MGNSLLQNVFKSNLHVIKNSNQFSIALLVITYYIKKTIHYELFINEQNVLYQHKYQHIYSTCR